jgi:hypothetical protein
VKQRINIMNETIIQNPPPDENSYLKIVQKDVDCLKQYLENGEKVCIEPGVQFDIRKYRAELTKWDYISLVLPTKRADNVGVNLSLYYRRTFLLPRRK